MYWQITSRKRCNDYIIILIIFVHFPAIGFLLAAKSILRGGSQESKKETEYILIGTLASFSAAIIAGIILLGTLQYFEYWTY